MKRLSRSTAKRRPNKPGRIETLDAIYERCHVIETLAGLLEACGDELVATSLMRDTGGLIRQELTQLLVLVDALELTKSPTARKARHL